jgi:hypothetical protein
LPPLATVVARLGGLPAGANRTAAATDLLRRVARQLSGDASVPFYPMRDVAALLKMSLADVARVYRRLDDDGLLLIKRGARTVLAPRQAQPRRAVRGVVAIPVWQYANTHWTDWRRFFTAIGRALRERHYAADFIFYGNDADPGGRAFAKALCANAPDFLLWFGMPPVRDTVLALHDAGTRLVAVTIEPSSLPVASYVLRWAQPLRQALAQYRRDGVRRLVVLLPERTALMPWAETILEESRLPYRLHRAPWGEPAQARRYLDALPGGRDTILFSPVEDWLSHLAQCDLLGLTRQLARHRWLTLHRLSLPAAMCRGLTVDVIAHDWPAVAGQIAEDIASHTLPAPDEPRYLQARYHPRAQAAAFAQEF